MPISLLGPRKIYVVLVRYVTDPPYSQPASFASTLAGEADTVLRYISNAQAWFDVKTAGPIDVQAVDMSNFSAQIAACEAAFTAAGLTPESDRKRLYVYDPLRYGGGGQAYINGPAAIIRGNGGVLVHEWLHTIGFQHASYGSNQYGDTTSLMGSGGYINPAESWIAGWFTNPASPDGNYFVGPWQPNPPPPATRGPCIRIQGISADYNGFAIREYDTIVIHRSMDIQPSIMQGSRIAQLSVGQFYEGSNQGVYKRLTCLAGPDNNGLMTLAITPLGVPASGGTPPPIEQPWGVTIAATSDAASYAGSTTAVKQ